MQLQQEAVMLGETAVQRVIQILGLRLQSLVGQRGQFARIPHALDHGLDHPASIAAHDVADHRIQPDVVFGQRLLDTLDVSGLLARSSCCSSSGTKLALISPKAARSASHSASFMSVLRPGTALMWAALTTINLNAPSLNIRQTGIQ